MNYPTGQALKDFMLKPFADMTPDERKMWANIWFENHKDRQAGREERHQF